MEIMYLLRYMSIIFEIFYEVNEVGNKFKWKDYNSKYRENID